MLRVPKSWVAGIVVAVLAVVCLLPLRADAGNTTSKPFPGVDRLHRRTADQNINVVSVDLCAAGVRVRATAANEAGRTAGSFGRLVGADIAINGDFHTPGSWATHGPAAHNGKQWSGSDGSYTGPVAFGDKRAGIVGHWKTGGLKPWMKEVVSGHPTIVVNGKVADQFVNPKNTDPLCNNRHPHTAVGLSENERELIIATVDGRRTSMKGMTCRELANLMVFFGAHTAVNMDGGGSTTMWLRGKGTVNHPSDGSPRTVSNHLAVFAPGKGRPHHCARYKAAYAGGEGAFKDGTRVELEAGTKARGTLKFVNVGKLEWDAKTRMGTTKPRDRKSPVRTSAWINPGRIAAVSSKTKPGEVGKFTFEFKAPSTPGTYKEHFNLVQETVTWFSDSGGPPDDQFYFTVVSKKSSSRGEDVGVDGGMDAGSIGESDASDAGGAHNDVRFGNADGGSGAADAFGETGEPTGQDSGGAGDSNVISNEGCGCGSTRSGVPPVAPVGVFLLVAVVSLRRFRR